MISTIDSTPATMNVPLADVRLSDESIAAVVDALRSGQLCQGEATGRFENSFADLIGVDQAIAVSSGSTALLVAMQALGVVAGDEVIVPDITYVSTATAAMYLGAKPVFCDISLGDFCIDTSTIPSLVNERTKLIVPVHLGGRVADMDAVRDIATSHGFAVLEDAAGAHLSSRDGRMAGTFGDAAIFSFTPTKLITTGEGGMIATNNGDLAERCRRIRNFGDHGKFAWHSLGFNFRMTATAAALGVEQLKRLPEDVQRQRALAKAYDQALGEIEAIRIPQIADDEQTNRQLYPVLFDVNLLAITRDDVIARLTDRGIASRLYYPALHCMKVFEPFGPHDDQHFPNAIRYANEALCLPMYPGMTAEQQQFVIDSLREIIHDATIGNATTA